MVANASVVALSEADHLGKETLAFRNRLFQYLVEELGFTAIAIESGLTEGQLIYDYVLGGPGDLATLKVQGLSWTFGEAVENEDLVSWIRKYNSSRPRGRRVRFYGFDVPGSPGNPDPARGIHTALSAALSFLATSDPVSADAFRARLRDFLELDPKQALEGYGALSGGQRDRITAAIADLVAVFERRAVDFAGTSSRSAAYEWGYRDAIGARQVDSWLRSIPPEWKAAAGMATWLPAAHEVRDRAMADNVAWILDQEGPDGKILLFASRFHMSNAPVQILNMALDRPNVVLGQHLKRRLGSRMVTIGNMLSERSASCRGAPSFDHLMGQLSIPSFLLDLRAAPASIRSWLDRPHTLGDSWKITVAVGQAFDILLYTEGDEGGC